MWKANGKTTTLQLFLDSLSPRTEKLSLEETMDLSRDRLILELDIEWRYSSTILDLGNIWRLVVSFTPLLLYSQI
jgi:hypothetical protein